MNQPTKRILFQVSNHHVADCGEPPFFDGDSRDQFISYFPNEYGEQLIFVYIYSDQKARLYHGDAGWDHPVPVVDGAAPQFELSDAEKLWVRACWMMVSSIRKLKSRGS